MQMNFPLATGGKIHELPGWLKADSSKKCDAVHILAKYNDKNSRGFGRFRRRGGPPRAATRTQTQPTKEKSAGFPRRF